MFVPPDEAQFSSCLSPLLERVFACTHTHARHAHSFAYMCTRSHMHTHMQRADDVLNQHSAVLRVHLHLRHLRIRVSHHGCAWTCSAPGWCHGLFPIGQGNTCATSGQDLHCPPTLDPGTQATLTLTCRCCWQNQPHSIEWALELRLAAEPAPTLPPSTRLLRFNGGARSSFPSGQAVAAVVAGTVSCAAPMRAGDLRCLVALRG